MWGQEGARREQREDLGDDVVVTEASADPTGIPGAGWPCQVVPHEARGQAFELHNEESLDMA